MVVTDIRDPRLARRPVGEQLDKVAGGLDVTLNLLTARLGEIIKTQQDGNALLAVMARTVTDDDTVGQGMGGVRPEHVSSISAKKAVLASAASTRVGTRRSMQPYTAAIDYTVDASGSTTLAQQTREGVRGGIANWMTGRATHLADQYDLHRGERLVTRGQNAGAVMGPTDGYFMDEQGRYRDQHGQFATAHDAVGMVMSANERSQLGAKLATSNTMSRVAQAWQEGQPIGRALMEALPQGALKAVGGASLAVTAANQGWQWVQGQYGANRQFQEAYGGSNMSQLGDRASQWWNRNITGRFSMLGGGAYDDLFKGAMNEGLRGNDRDRYIGTGANIMGQGVNAEQTKRIMDMSIEAGLGLTGLATAIKEVNSAAREAGVNARHARDIFIKNYEASSDLMFGSQNAKPFATALTAGQLAQARPFQNINALGMMQSVPVQQMRASQLGMSLGQYEVATTKSPAGTILGNEETLKRAIDTAPNPGGTKSVRTLVQEFIAQNGGYNAKYDQIALGEYLKENGWNEVFCHTILTTYGIDDGGAHLAPGYIGNLYTNESAGNMAAKSEAQRQVDFTPKTFTADQVKMKDAYAADTEGVRNTRALGTLGITGGGNAGQLAKDYLSGLTGKDMSGNKGAFAALEGKTMLPGVSKLLEQTSTLGLSEKTKVRVKVQGGYRVISLADALRDFPDQVASGAVFVSGVGDAYMNKSVGDITGAPAGTVTSNTKTIDYGQTAEQFDAEEAKKKKDSASSTQKVTLDLSPEAKRLLVPMMDQSYYSPSAATSGVGP